MHVLTCDVNETVTIDDIRVVVLEITETFVRLGITDPQATPDYREELIYLASTDAEATDALPTNPDAEASPLGFAVIDSHLSIQAAVAR